MLNTNQEGSDSSLNSQISKTGLEKIKNINKIIVYIIIFLTILIASIISLIIYKSLPNNKLESNLLHKKNYIDDTTMLEKINNIDIPKILLQNHCHSTIKPIIHIQENTLILNYQDCQIIVSIFFEPTSQKFFLIKY